jgi:hypothetical protein
MKCRYNAGCVDYIPLTRITYICSANDDIPPVVDDIHSQANDDIPPFGGWWKDLNGGCGRSTRGKV